MRGWLFVCVLAISACSHSGSSGPAWPKDRARDDDGGESLAPRKSSTAVALAADTDGDSDNAAADSADKPADKAATAATETGAPATNAAAPAPAEDPVTTEEIVIEVGPDD
jgi:hypothetical protein